MIYLALFFVFLLSKRITFSLLCLGLFFATQTKAATYTHSLEYSQQDAPGDTLVGPVTFDDEQVPSNTVNSAFDSNFITDITFTYTPNGGTAQTITYSDFTDGGDFDRFTFVAPSPVNFAFVREDGLLDQLTNLQFGADGGNFNLSISFNTNQVDATTGIETADFLLTGTSFVSPAPLPLLGIIPAFSSISRLKKRYKLKNNT